MAISSDIAAVIAKAKMRTPDWSPSHQSARIFAGAQNDPRRRLGKVEMISTMPPPSMFRQSPGWFLDPIMAGGGALFNWCRT